MMTKTLIAMLVLGSTTVGIASTASAAPLHMQAAKVEVRAPSRIVEKTRIEPTRVIEHAPTRIEQRPVVVETRVTPRPIVEQRPVIEQRVTQRVDIHNDYRRDNHWQWRGGRYIYVADYVAPAPIVVVAPAPFANGQQFLGLGDATGTGVELATNGATFVRQANIEYADGHNQVVTLNQELDANSPTLTLATDGCPVNGVLIYGQGAALSAYSI